MKKKVLWILLCFFIGMISTTAKEYDFYFYPNGGKVKTSGFELGDYGYLSYNGNFYANYNEKSTIKKINSIKGVSFQLEKSGTSLVSGKEWYTIVDGKTYFFNQSKTYSMKTVLKTLKLENEDFYSFDLYANWSNKKRTSGIDISSGKETTSSTNKEKENKSTSSTNKEKENKSTSGTNKEKEKKATSSTKKATNQATSFTITAEKNWISVGKSITLNTTFKPNGSTKEKITWTTSDKKIATVSSQGKVVGVSIGTVTITGVTKSGLKSTKNIKVIKAPPTNIERKGKVLGTISKENSSVFAKLSNAYEATSAQSLCVTDQYYVVVKVKGGNTSGVIHVIDKNSGEVVNYLKGNFGHANGSTFNKDNGNIYITHLFDQEVTVINKNNLKKPTLKSSQKQFLTPITALAYDYYTKKWVLKTGTQINVYNKNFSKHLKSFSVVKHIGQDAGVYKGLLLSINFIFFDDSDLYIYDISTGKLYGRYHLTLPGELESVDYDATNDVFVLLFNGPDRIYTTKAINLNKFIK